jgi:hypothetical protein
MLLDSRVFRATAKHGIAYKHRASTLIFGTQIRPRTILSSRTYSQSLAMMVMDACIASGAVHVSSRILALRPLWALAWPPLGGAFPIRDITCNPDPRPWFCTSNASENLRGSQILANLLSWVPMKPFLLYNDFKGLLDV